MAHNDVLISAGKASAAVGRRPRYRTWIRGTRLAVFSALSGVCLAWSALSLLSPWFLLFLVPFALFGYIAMILALTVYRLAPRGADLQRRIHDLIVARAQLSAASRALDVGCGSGSLVVKLAGASEDCTVTGVETGGRGGGMGSLQGTVLGQRADRGGIRPHGLPQAERRRPRVRRRQLRRGGQLPDLPRDQRCGAQIRRHGRDIAGPAARRAVCLPRLV